MTVSTDRYPDVAPIEGARTPGSDREASVRLGRASSQITPAQERVRAPRPLAAFVGVAIAGMAIVGCGGSEPETESGSASRASSTQAAAPKTTTSESKPARRASELAVFRRFVREAFGDVSWASSVKDAYEGGFVPTLVVTSASPDLEIAKGICSGINMWILDEDSDTDVERGEVRYAGVDGKRTLTKCRPGVETEVVDG